MNKQEFLAMSLPYDLVGITQNRLVKINGINYEKQLPIVWDSIDKEKSDFSGMCGFGIMPILHPLSDLIKPIEYKGKKFQSSYILSRDFKNAEDFIFLLIQIINGKEDMDLFKIMEYCPINIIQKLIEWHFDIAGLIEEGEAIDVNTLEANPYK